MDFDARLSRETVHPANLCVFRVACRWFPACPQHTRDCAPSHTAVYFGRDGETALVPFSFSPRVLSRSPHFSTRACWPPGFSAVPGLLVGFMDTVCNTPIRAWLLALSLTLRPSFKQRHIEKRLASGILKTTFLYGYQKQVPVPL